MEHTYPVHLQLFEQTVVVIGGGQVAERKVVSILNSGANIILISPEITDNLLQLVQSKKIKWKQKCYSSDDTKDAFLIIAATNNRELNQKVKQSINKYQLINLVDNPKDSTFVIPSIVRKGRLVISISTSGASPTLTKQIRNQLEYQFDENYEEYIDFLYDCRQWILKNVNEPHIKNQLLKEIVGEDFLKAKNRKERFQQLFHLIGENT